MKMVKSLLLGSAAGVVAVAGAQAADLPVKAKAVEYVKICSLYGAGFYYIPGTDICMKVGGFVRFQYNFANGGNDISNGPYNGAGGRDNRVDSQDWGMRSRAVATFDTRQQTQYGVLRTYLLMGYSQDPPAAGASAKNTIYATRGFIQIAGFTFGKATSYMDFYPAASLAYNAGLIIRGSDTGDTGQVLAAYTAMFGGGVSATISVEASQRGSTVVSGAGAYSLGAAPTSSDVGQGGLTTGSTGNPDIVGNLRWDGNWGAFQVAGVLHDASGGYYGASEQSGHPSNKWGYAFNTGLRINTPMIGPGDYLVASFNYSVGATKFTAGPNIGSALIWNGGTVGYGNIEDGIYGGTATTGLNSIELTTGWNVAAGYEHFWTPALQTSLYGSYLKIAHNANATALICIATTSGAYSAAVGCNPDFSMWDLGSRTQWNVVKGLYVGLDVIYTKLKSATPGATNLITVVANGAKAAGTYGVADQSTWAFAFRVQRDILP